MHPGCGALMMVMMQIAAAMTLLELDLGQRTVMMHWVAAMVLDSGHWTLELSCAHYHNHALASERGSTLEMCDSMQFTVGNNQL